jgi:glycosyltransferase involved in cell wall biosynthesis
VLCLNEDDRLSLISDLHRTPDTVTRVVPGADPIYAAAAEHRDYSHATRVLFAATWRKNKGIEDLVPAFTVLAERHDHLTLHAVGAGVSPEFVRAQFPERVRPRIHCDTPSDEAGTAAAFAAADLFVLPSLFEGTPLTLIQAMMSGLPIVTTATCGMKDVIINEGTGLLIPIRSSAALVAAVERLLGDQALRERLGRAARCQAARHYSWENSAEPVLRVYEGLR